MPTRRVLVVDDTRDNRELMTRFLEHDGYEVLTAANGADALAILRETSISLVLLDVHMPGMDGLEVCGRIRRDPRCRKIPVVLITADDVNSGGELAGLEVGADEYLHRPISRQVLAARVRNLLRLADAEREEQMLAQVAQSEKLAGIGQVAAGVAHEINNPLAFVLSNLETLRGYFEDFGTVLAAWKRSPEEGAKAEAAVGFETVQSDLAPLLEETIEGGERMRSIVRELKTFMRGQDDEVESVDLSEVVRSTLVLTERDLSQKAVLVRDLGSAWIEGAPRQRLHQVVLNLIVNAKQAIESRPLAPGSQHCVEVTTRSENGMAILTVADSGAGIPEDIRQRIFEPFFTTKPVGVGVGLGLSLCAMVMEQLGGTVQVDSRVGEGTRFTLRIPMVRPVASSSSSIISAAVTEALAG
ncbi:MAG: sensor histidine kinase [Archangium sp.]